MTMDDRLHRIAQVFDDVNRTYFDGVIPTPTFLLNTRMASTAGRAWGDKWMMEISVPYHEEHGWEDELVDTVKHEAVHLYLACRLRPAGHTREFKTICARIGATRWCKAMPRRRPHYRYRVRCEHCGHEGLHGSWRQDLACGACCQAHNGGRYTPKFQLTLLTRSTLP